MVARVEQVQGNQWVETRPAVVMQPTLPATTNRRIERWSILHELTWLLFALWLVLWVVPAVPRYATLLWIHLSSLILILLISARLRYRGAARTLGFRFDNFWAAMRGMTVPLAIFLGICLTIGWFSGSLRFNQPRFWWALAFGPTWGLIQEYVFQGFINRRLQMVFGSGWVSAGLTALIFAAVHLPNPMLTLATGLGGLIWARQYQLTPNLWAIGLMHGVCSAIFSSSMPSWLLKSMIVGYRYWF